MKAFLLAAGLGTRLKPFTDHHPKALATVNGKTVLEWNIQKMQKFGINEFVINVHHFPEQIIKFLEENNGFGSRYFISDESECLLETGGALLHAKPFLENTDHILMMNVDIISNIDLKQLIQFHLVHQPLATLAVQKRNSSRQLLFQENDRDELVLKGWKDNQNNLYKPSNFVSNDASIEYKERAFSGIQIINSDIFNELTHQGKFTIIDAYLDLMTRQPILGYDHTGDIMLDIGSAEKLAEAEKILS